MEPSADAVNSARRIVHSTREFTRAMIRSHRVARELAAAARIHRAWRRYSLFAHARLAAWPSSRAEIARRLGPLAFREAYRRWHVRREWRRELHSWCAPRLAPLAPPIGAAALLAEAARGLWGSRSRVI